MKLEVRSASLQSVAEKAYIDDWSSKIFAGQDMGLEWASGDWHVLLWEGDELASLVEIVDRTGIVGDQPVRLGGIGGVATTPTLRGRGLASQAMQKAMEFMRLETQIEFGLLICDTSRIPFYQRLGWQLVADRMVIEQSGQKMDFQSPVMVWSCQGKEWPAGKIDLCGLPW